MEEKLMVYIEVHQLRNQRVRISQIAKRQKISRTTVYKYLEMSFEEAIEEFEPCARKKKLDPFRDWIVNWLREFPSLSGTQIIDWLQERFPDIDVGESTVRRYVTLIKKVAQENPELVHHGIEKCIDENLYRANAFRDVVDFL